MEVTRVPQVGNPCIKAIWTSQGATFMTKSSNVYNNISLSSERSKELSPQF